MSEESSSHPLYDAIMAEIATVDDPEMGISLLELGLIYDLIINEENSVYIEMTLTSMGCPVGPELAAAIRTAAMRVEGVKDVEVEIVWTPPWDPSEMASEDAKMVLGIL